MAEIKNLADLKQAMEEKQQQEDEYREKYPGMVRHSGLPDVSAIFLDEEIELLGILQPVIFSQVKKISEEQDLRVSQLAPIINLKKILQGIVKTKFVSARDIINILHEIIAEDEKEIETEVPPEL